jgi:hypothetical protein
MLTAWAHNTIRYCRQFVPYEDHAKHMSTMQAYGSLDLHLLQGLATAIHATSIHDAIPHNSFIPTPTLSISEPSTGQHPTVVNGYGSDFDW